MNEHHEDIGQAVVGILETRNDPFVQDLASRLGRVEFVAFGEESVSPSAKFRVIIDRTSYRYPYLREMLKGLALDGCYVLNNPFAASMTNKLVDLRLCHHLEIPVPKTLVLPDLQVRQELADLVLEPCWDRLNEAINFPCIMKPFDGYGWTDVYVVHNPKELRDLYINIGPAHTFLVQQLIEYVDYFRVFCIGHTESFVTRWIPRPLGAGEYLLPGSKTLEKVRDRMVEMTARINTCLDLDINVLEWCLDTDGRPWLIDAFNDVPDIQKDKLPPECYWWIVDKLVACVQEKVRKPIERNRIPFVASAGLLQEDKPLNQYYDTILRQVIQQRATPPRPGNWPYL